MSTVTEAITAAHCGLKLVAFTVNNMVAGILDQPLTTDEADEIAGKHAKEFKALLGEVLRDM